MPQLEALQHETPITSNISGSLLPFLRRHRLGLGLSGAALSLTAACSTASKSSAPHPVRTITEAPTIGPNTDNGSYNAKKAEQSRRDVGKAVLLPGSRHKERAEYPASTFTQWYDDQGRQALIHTNQVIYVDCVERGTNIPSGPADYHIIEPKADATEFAPANVFWNQVPAHAPDTNHAIDPNVPNCPSAP